MSTLQNSQKNKTVVSLQVKEKEKQKQREKEKVEKKENLKENIKIRMIHTNRGSNRRESY